MPENSMGKKFEVFFRQNIKRCFPEAFVYRLPDQQSGYLGASQNICDFFVFYKGILYLLELKAHKGASVPFDAISQYERMKKYAGIKQLRAGVLIFLYEKDIVLYVPISTLTQLKADGEKSVGLRHLDNYNIKVIPGVKKRVFIENDYSVLLDLKEGE